MPKDKARGETRVSIMNVFCEVDRDIPRFTDQDSGTLRGRVPDPTL